MNGPRLALMVMGAATVAAMLGSPGLDAASASSEPPVTIHGAAATRPSGSATSTSAPSVSRPVGPIPVVADPPLTSSSGADADTAPTTPTTTATLTPVVAPDADDATLPGLSPDTPVDVHPDLVDIDGDEATDPVAEAEADSPCVWSAADDYYTGAAGGPIFVGASTWWGSNDDVCASTYITHTDPSHGTVDIDYPAQYTPDPGFTGVDSFVYSYEMPMGTVHASATVYITVTDCHVAASSDNLFETAVDTPLVVDAPGILENDTLGCPSLSVDADPAQHGTIDVNDDGSFLYTPDAGYMGLDKIEYRLVDPAANVLAAATIRIEVNGPPCVAADDSYSVHSGDVLDVAAPGVLLNDVVCPQFLTTGDGGFNALPEHGTVAMDGDGSFTYTPDPGHVGPDSFGYSIYYGNSDSSSASVDIEVLPPCATALVDDAYTVAVSTVLHVAAPGPGANDTLCGGDELEVADGPDHGALTLLDGGDMTYEPDPGFAGTDTFTYTVATGPTGYFGEARPVPFALAPGAVPAPTATVTIVVSQEAASTTSTTSVESIPAVPSMSGTLPATGAADKGVMVGFAVSLMLTGTCLLLAIRRPRPR